MKLFSVIALFLALGGGVLSAQQDMGNSQVTGATYTTGVVRAVYADSVVIQKDSGESQTLLIDKATVGAANLAVGARARIDFHVNDSDQAIADHIESVTLPAPTLPATATTASTAPSTAPSSPNPPPPVAPSPAPAPTTAPTYGSTSEPTSPSATTELPATASNIVLLALLGLASLGGALTLRVSRR